jgi:hypothetical protein
MLKFQNKEGVKVMEMNDQGEVKIEDKKLEESFKDKKKEIKENVK